MATGLTIRRYQASDRDDVWVLQHMAEGTLTPAQVPTPQPDDPDYGDFQHIDTVYLQRGGEFLVGLHEGRIVAMGAIERTNTERADVKRMRVHRDYQRRGFGRAIIQALEARAVELGYSTLHLDTTVDRVPARRLYLNSGFHETGRTVLGGRWECVLYEKRIAPPRRRFPVTFSLPSPDAVRGGVAHAYARDQLAHCRLLRSYTNDVYIVDTASDTYILKVYGAGWRSAAEIAYELDVLAHLTAKGVAVAPAVQGRYGRPKGSATTSCSPTPGARSQRGPSPRRCTTTLATPRRVCTARWMISPVYMPVSPSIWRICSTGRSPR